MDEETPKIKRGRKPKDVQPKEPQTSSEKEPVAKRGRKPKVIYNTYEPAVLDTTAMNETSDDENIVLKLNISSSIDESVKSTNMDNIPDGYNIGQNDTFESKPIELDMLHSEPHEDWAHLPDNKSCQSEYEQATSINLKVVHLLKDFEEKNKNNEWPSNTSIACYWCCHRFENAPLGIPVKYVNGRFYVFGCFCSLECAASHNLASKESIDEMWERYNLINLLARRIGYNKCYVKPAPNRLTLRMFGGHLSIEEFRSYTQLNKFININFPPMLSMTQQIEELNESDISNDYKYIPIDTDRINKYKEKIKLKRTKPLHDHKNTLDHAMNLKFGV